MKGERKESPRHASATRPAAFSTTTIAWTVVLLCSDLPDAIWQALAGAPPTWLFWAKVVGLLAIILLGYVLKPLYSLRAFFILLLIFDVGLSVSPGITRDYVLGGDQSGLLLRMAQYEGLRILKATAMVSALLVVPAGVEGFFITAALGWLYAIMMVETTGVSMPWFNHFLADVPSYLFWAISLFSG